MDKIIDRDEFQSIGSIADKLVGGLVLEQEWDGKPISVSGLYSGVPIETYHSDTSLFDSFAISSSGLRAVLERPRKYWAFSPYNEKRFERPDTNPHKFGQAAHMLLLGEEGFKKRYVMQPENAPDDPRGLAWNANNKYCKAWLKAQKEAGRVVITETEINHIRNIAESLSEKEAIRIGILNGRIERSMFLRDKGIWLKARPDAVPNDSGDFVDLKTAVAVDDESISKAIYSHGYHVQAGLMRLIAREVLGPDSFTSFTFVFVEKAPPYDVRVMQLKDEDIDLGESLAHLAIGQVQECLKRNHWPGFDGFNKEISFTEMPSWAKTRIKINLEAA